MFRPGLAVIWGGRARCLGQDRQGSGEEGTGIQARTGQGLEREGQINRPGQVMAKEQRDRCLAWIWQWPGEEGRVSRIGHEVAF